MFARTHKEDKKMKGNSVIKRCPEYIGVSCIDGTCPKANQEEYEEYGIPVVRTCYECSYYRGCEDCAGCGCDEALKQKYQ